MDYSRLFDLLKIRGMGRKDAIVLLALIVFAFQISGIFYRILGIAITKTAETKTIAAASPAPASFAKAPEDSYRVIGERNLFGSTDKSLSDKQTGGEQAAPLATLLQVRGTVAGGEKFGFAVIEERGKGKQGLYRIGDKVAGATVVRIMRDKVAFRIEGREEILRRVESTEAPILPPGKREMAAAAPAAGGKILSRSEIAGSLKDLGQMLSQAQIRPYFTAGVPDGFLVSNIQSGSIFQRLGLIDGDIIQELNSHRIQGADDIIEMYNTMKAGTSLALKVKRQGRQEQIDFAIR